MNQQTAKERLENIDNILDEYEKSIGVPSCRPVEESELSQYLSMNKDMIEKLSPEDCAIISMRLAQAAFYIQRTQNKEKSRSLWANSELTKLIAVENSNYDKYLRHDLKVATIIKDNSYASSLYEISRYADQRVQRLEFLATSLKNLSDVLINVNRAKVQMSKGQ